MMPTNDSDRESPFAVAHHENARAMTRTSLWILLSAFVASSAVSRNMIAFGVAASNVGHGGGGFGERCVQGGLLVAGVAAVIAAALMFICIFQEKFRWDQWCAVAAVVIALVLDGLEIWRML